MVSATLPLASGLAGGCGLPEGRCLVLGWLLSWGAWGPVGMARVSGTFWALGQTTKGLVGVPQTLGLAEKPGTCKRAPRCQSEGKKGCPRVSQLVPDP